MADIEGYIRYERRRMVQVRRSLVRAIGESRKQPRDLADFYRACADYILYSQGRVHKEDQAIADRLKTRVPASEREEHARIDKLLAGIERSRTLTADYRNSAAGLGTDDMGRQKAFEDATEYLFTEGAKAMGGGRNPMNLSTDRVMTETDWAEIAHASATEKAEEQRLYARVQKAAPVGLDPAAMPPTHPQSWSDY